METRFFDASGGASEEFDGLRIFVEALAAQKPQAWSSLQVGLISNDDLQEQVQNDGEAWLVEACTRYDPTRKTKRANREFHSTLPHYCSEHQIF
jgi:hypothetical protein